MIRTEPAFFLSEESTFERMGKMLDHPDWIDTFHTLPMGHAFLILPMETVRFNKKIHIDSPMVLKAILAPALPECSFDGMDVTLSFVTSRKSTTILRSCFAKSSKEEAWREWICDLQEFTGDEGFLEVSVGAGSESIPDGDWLALRSLVVAKREDLELLEVYESKKKRIKPWTIHDSESPVVWNLSDKKYIFDNKFFHRSLNDALLCRPIYLVPPVPNDVLWPYVKNEFMRLAYPQQQAELSYATRLIELTEKKCPLQVLLLGSGGNGSVLKTFLDLFSWCKQKVILHLVESYENKDLLSHEILNDYKFLQLNLMVGDEDDLRFSRKQFDLIILHGHFLDRVFYMDHFFKNMSEFLSSQGELWLIDLYIGKKGREWDPAIVSVANQQFASLPEELRMNSLKKTADRVLENIDIFLKQGLESEAIFPSLYSLFSPYVQVQWNILLNMFFGPLYHQNYNLNNPDHFDCVQRILNLEIQSFLNGKKCNTLSGIFFPLRKLAN